MTGLGYDIAIGRAKEQPAVPIRSVCNVIHVELCLRVFCRTCQQIIARMGAAAVMTDAELAESIADHEQTRKHLWDGRDHPPVGAPCPVCGVDDLVHDEARCLDVLAETGRRP